MNPKRMILSFLAPTVILLLLIFLYPIIYTSYLSFTNAVSFSQTPESFRGMRNYLELLRTPLFLRSFRNIALIWLVGGASTFFLAFLFTALLNAGIRFKGFWRAVIYLPNIINVVALVAMWTQYIYNPRYGLLHTVFEKLGLQTLADIPWTSPGMLLWSMLIAFTWGAIGFNTLIILAGAERIPAELYEAARLEGAGLARSFISITVPLLRDVLRVAVTLWSINIINLFAFPKVFSPLGQTVNTYTPSIYMYELAFGGGGPSASGALQVGKAAAASVMLLLLVIVIAAVIGRMFGREQAEY